jgi:rare lipoprotein A (peptidoglycan hydrolase)
MKTKQILICKALLVGVIVFLAVPLVNIPVFAPTAIKSTDVSALRWAQLLANPKRTFNKPLKTWECVSSWYGEDFDGQPTADGELYDMYAMTAAHRTLPLGSIVRVVNLRTHRSAVVRINDRGPYVTGRDLDVSYQVARQLGFLHRGLARVKLELLKVPSQKRKLLVN